MMAWTVSGSGSPADPSSSGGSGWRSRTMRTYSSANRGLPPAAATRAGPTPVGSRWEDRRVSSSWPVSASDSGSSSTAMAEASLPPQPGRRASRSLRAVATSSSGASGGVRGRSGRPCWSRVGWPVGSSSSWRKSSRASSAQCRSSSTSTSGRRLASPYRKRRQAVNASSRRPSRLAVATAPLSGAPASSSPSPTSPRRCPETQSMAAGSSAMAWATTLDRRRATRSAESVSRMPASALTISARAQWVTPPPGEERPSSQGEERPCRQVTRSLSASRARPSSATSRLLPMPGGPSRVTSRGRRSALARWNASSRMPSSRSRPTRGTGPAARASIPVRLRGSSALHTLIGLARPARESRLAGP